MTLQKKDRLSTVSIGLNILFILWTILEDQLEYQMSFETLLKSTNKRIV